MMVSSLRFAVLMVAGLATCVGQADNVFFDSSFTTTEGFADGGIGTDATNPNTIIGQAGFSITDSSGVGILNGGSGFQRALFGYNTGMDEAYVNNTASEIRISATGLVFNPTGANVGSFGLANIDSGNPLGASNLAAGIQFTWDGTNLFLDRNTDFAQSFDLNTGVVSGESFNYEQRYLALGGGAYDIEHYVNGSLLGTSANVTPNFDKSGLGVSGFINDRGGAGAYSMDGLGLSGFSSVPEPSSLGLFAVGIAAFAGRRRRR